MKIKINILLILCLCFFTSGCWNYNELNDFAIVTGIGIDKHDEGYKVSLLISNAQTTQGSSKEGEAQTSVFTGIGKTINEALGHISVKSPKILYLSHLGVAIVDEEIAKEDINNILDALMRNPESAKKYYLIIARDDKSEDILKTLSPLEAFPSQNIFLTIQNTANNQGITREVILSDFIIDILKPGINNIIPSISLQGKADKNDNQDDLKNSEPNSMIKIETLGLFKDYKLVTWTTKKESQGINIINNAIERMFLTSYFENDKYNVTLLDKVKTKFDVKIEENSNISVNINTKAEGALIETNRTIDLNDPKEIEKINEKAEEILADIIYDGIKVSQQYKTDVFGFGNMVYKKNPTYWKKIKDKWDDEYFPNLKIKVKTSVNIKTKGALETTIKEKVNGN